MCTTEQQVEPLALALQGGDLRNALAADGENKVTWWNKGKEIACDVARGLAFLHSNKIIHRDLKSKNVLLTKDYEAKITDVGMAKLMSDAYFTQDQNFGTFSWAAPEVLLGEKCSEKVDCYSVRLSHPSTCCALRSAIPVILLPFSSTVFSNVRTTGRN